MGCGGVAVAALDGAILSGKSAPSAGKPLEATFSPLLLPRNWNWRSVFYPRVLIAPCHPLADRVAQYSDVPHGGSRRCGSL